ncbi:UNVERIFIED_CONTAM: hypothetical protein GTU68_038497 [Idotea baltica]|nr:hypothetical protein [Idotea baltica]
MVKRFLALRILINWPNLECYSHSITQVVQFVHHQGPL